MKKSKIKIIIIVFFICILGITYYTQFHKPLRIQAYEVEGQKGEVLYEALELFHEDYINGNYDKESHQFFNLSKKLPSSNISDYMSIRCNLKVKNRSILNVNYSSSIITEIKTHKNRALYSMSIDETNSRMPERFSDGIVTFVLQTYVGGMSKKDIKDLIQGIKVKVVYDGDYYGKKSEIIDFKNCDSIKLDK